MSVIPINNSERKKLLGFLGKIFRKIYICWWHSKVEIHIKLNYWFGIYEIENCQLIIV